MCPLRKIGYVDPTTDLSVFEKKKHFPLPGFELRSFLHGLKNLK